MNKSVKVILQGFVFSFLPFMSIAQGETHFLLADANDYFRTGRYWDAFFLYKDLARTPEFQDNYEVATQIKNSSHAMYLRKKFVDYRAYQKYELAKKHLSELISLNPEDPDRGELPKITLKQAEDMQRYAWRQRSSEATSQMLRKAIEYYHQAMREGLKDESISTAIRLCEYSLEKTGVEPQPTTTYGITPTQTIEREREVKIIKEEN